MWERRRRHGALAVRRARYDGQLQFLSVSWDYNAALGSTALNGKIGGVALHEYGHNLGVWHANSLDCGTSPINSRRLLQHRVRRSV